MELVSHAIATMVGPSKLLGQEGKQISGREPQPWPNDRLVKCLSCGFYSQPGNADGGEWICQNQNCGQSTLFGFERAGCVQCGTEIRGHRRGKWVHWGACFKCDPAEAKRLADVNQHHNRQEKREKSLQMQLKIQREAAAECLGKRPACKVKKKSDPEKPFCRACKGGIDA